MKKVIILRGLPASGKSTWAKKQVEDNPGKYARVNKDDLREMMHSGRWSKHNESLVLIIRDLIVFKALSHGQHVIVDDTNLHPKHIDQISQLAKDLGAQVEVKDFEVSVETAVKRDLKRAKSVGRDVIEGMYNNFIKPKPEVYTPPINKPKAIIVDIDGTLAHMNGRSPYDLEKVDTDTFDDNIAEIVESYISSDINVKVILLSGREDSARDKTIAWLDDNDFHYDHLFMRKADDRRKDYIVKRELFDANVREEYQVQFVLDDRNQVVEMWRQMGLKCLQVADGNF